jgi:hypothetical protein
MAEYTLRQTTPEQVMTHWSTCYSHHSSCMERKVETMTQEIQALRKAGEALWVELEDAAFGYEGVNWKVQRDAPPVLAAWRALVGEGKEA